MPQFEKVATDKDWRVIEAARKYAAAWDALADGGAQLSVRDGTAQALLAASRTAYGKAA